MFGEIDMYNMGMTYRPHRVELGRFLKRVRFVTRENLEKIEADFMYLKKEVTPAPTVLSVSTAEKSSKGMKNDESIGSYVTDYDDMDQIEETEETPDDV